uniref:Putative secreted protein n=1 Tax=Anopheles darlingi TaxID=43151 RepID=A0A2M4D9Y3_ANODA
MRHYVAPDLLLLKILVVDVELVLGGKKIYTKNPLIKITLPRYNTQHTRQHSLSRGPEIGFHQIRIPGRISLPATRSQSRRPLFPVVQPTLSSFRLH